MNIEQGIWIPHETVLGLFVDSVSRMHSGEVNYYDCSYPSGDTTWTSYVAMPDSMRAYVKDTRTTMGLQKDEIISVYSRKKTLIRQFDRVITALRKKDSDQNKVTVAAFEHLIRLMDVNPAFKKGELSPSDVIPFSLAVAKDSDTKVSWAESFDAIYRDDISVHGRGNVRKAARFGTFLDKAVHLGALPPDFPIENCTQEFGVYALNSTRGVEVLSGEEGFREAYRSEIGSCMRNTDYPAEFYGINPDKCSIAVVREDGKIAGRAILWTTDDGSRVLDRCYPNNSRISNMLRDWAKAQKIVVRDNDSLGTQDQYEKIYKITMRHKRVFPYVDTFAHCDDNPYKKEVIVISNDGDDPCILQQTDGTWYGCRLEICSCCCERYDEDEMTRVRGGALVCEGCLSESYTFIESSDTWVPDSDAEECACCATMNIRSDLEAVHGGDLVCSTCIDEQYTWVPSSREYANTSEVCQCDNCHRAFLTENMMEGEEEDSESFYCSPCWEHLFNGGPEPVSRSQAAYITDVQSMMELVAPLLRR